MDSILYKTIEVVGTQHWNNGRMCGLHRQSCGASLQVGMHLKLNNATIQVPIERTIPVINDIRPAVPKGRGRPKKTIQEVQKVVEITDVATVKAFVWTNGVQSCCVGFVSVAFQCIYCPSLDGRIVDVRRILDESDSESEQSRSKENNGMIQCIIIG
jgi:hypothetical protein